VPRAQKVSEAIDDRRDRPRHFLKAARPFRPGKPVPRDGLAQGLEAGDGGADLAGRVGVVGCASDGIPVVPDVIPQRRVLRAERSRELSIFARRRA
jgi:hypothetical protein